MTITKILIKRAVTTDVNQPLPEEYYRLLENLQELDFVLVELTLYLDTHPDDTAAINQFNDFSYKRRVLKQQMEEKYDHFNSTEIAILMPLGNGAKVLGHGKYKRETMWIYEKKLQYPVKVGTCNPALAKLLIEQYGGADGELAAALRYLNQRYTILIKSLASLPILVQKNLRILK